MRLSAIAAGSVLTSSLLPSCSPKTTTAGLTTASMRLMWLPQAQFAGPYVALDQGFYKDEGLDLTLSPGGPNLYPTNLVASDTDDFGTLGPTACITSRDQGLPLKTVLIEFDKDHCAMVSHADSGITRPKDFEGKKVAIWFGELQYRVRAMVVEDGGDPTLMTEIPQGADLTPFVQGQWDVCSTTKFNELITLRDELKVPMNIFDLADYKCGMPAQGAASSDKVLQREPKIATAFVSGTIRGWKWALENPEATVDIVMKQGSGLNRDHQVAMLKECLSLLQTGQVPTKGIGYIDPSDMQRAIDFLYNYKIISATQNVADTYWDAGWNSVPDSVKKI